MFFFQGRLDTLFQLQSILTLIVQTTVNCKSILKATKQGALKVPLQHFLFD